MIVPASLVLGVWMIFQLLGQASVQRGQGGVAYLAHIGGFIAGFATGILLRFTKTQKRSYSARYNT